MAAFNIGNVVSPTVAAALVRKGESRGGGGIQRRDPLKRTQTTNTEDKDQAAFDREARLQQAQDAGIDLAQLRMDFDREKFDAGVTADDKNREAQIEAGKAKAAGARKIGEGKARGDVTQIIKAIGKAMAAGRKVGDDGKPNPAAIAAAAKEVQALWQQIQNSGLPPEELAQLGATIMGQQPSNAPRAPGAGIQRAGPPPALGQDGLPGGDPSNPLRPVDVQTGLATAAPNAEPPGEELLSVLEQRGWLQRLPQGAQLHDDGTMTLLDGKRVPISEQFLLPDPNGGNFSRGGGNAPKVEAGLSRELGTPTRTP